LSMFGILWRVFFVLCAWCCQFLWIVHFRYSLTCILRPVCLMLPVSLDCPCSVFSNVYSSYCVPYVGSFSGLSMFGILWRVFFVMCALCCQFLWIVHVRYSLTCILRHVCLMLVVSLDCPCSVFSNVYSSSCVPYVASFSGLSMFCIL
jgi:hypothetical protein